MKYEHFVPCWRHYWSTEWCVSPCAVLSLTAVYCGYHKFSQYFYSGFKMLTLYYYPLLWSVKLYQVLGSQIKVTENFSCTEPWIGRYFSDCCCHWPVYSVAEATEEVVDAFSQSFSPLRLPQRLGDKNPSTDSDLNISFKIY